MSPFKSLKQAAVAVVGSFLASFLAERLDNAEMLKDVTAPVFIVHGKKDDLIPYSQAQSLLDCCIKSRFTYLILPAEMTHNRFNVEEDLVRPLLKFLHKARLDLSCRSNSVVTPSSNKVGTTRDIVFRSSNLRVKAENNFYQNIRKDQDKFTLEEKKDEQPKRATNI